MVPSACERRGSFGPHLLSLIPASEWRKPQQLRQLNRRKTMKILIAMTSLIAALSLNLPAYGAEPRVKVLPAAEDATQKTVLIGRNMAGDMIIIFELEPAKGMWMEMGGKWTEHRAGKGEVFHVEVKPEDPKSGTRIPYAKVSYTAVNRDSGKKVSGALHPMWGGSGLHYAANSALAGNGVYETTITVGVPAFGRAPQDKNLWMKPVTTKFHFKLAGGKVIEVTEPAAPQR
jgi:uncharacterized protein involved in high-affinity Fe2+ transport